MTKLKKLRIYVDTSVIGGCLDEEFKEVSIKLIEKIKRGEIIAIISELTKLELNNAPKEVQEILDEIPEENLEIVELSEEAVELANSYIAEKVLGEKKLVDAEHIAIATIHQLDLL